jgi:magnesium chelatase subunit I
VNLPQTFGALRQDPRYQRRSVKDEMRDNLRAKLAGGETLFPGVLGYEDTVVPRVVNAILSRHNFILLGLRGQAKSRLLRALTTLLDEQIPTVAGCEIHDDPWAPLCKRCRDLMAAEGDATPSPGSARDDRYVEKLATPDVTIADVIGDVDPIRAARGGHDLSSELTVHYGLLPRAHRGIFALNELPDLAGRIQVGLFNILQEGDVQIKGYPVRLPLDVCMVFTANPEDYTARGKIITPLKDRIGSEIRTHYPGTIEQGVAITQQEAWTDRAARLRCRASCARWRRASPSRRGATSASTSAAASASACPSRALETRSRTPSAARCARARSVVGAAHLRPLRGAAAVTASSSWSTRAS